MVVRTDETLKLLDEAADTTPFARLLATAGPRRLAHAAQPGHPFAAAVLARALDAPVLALAADPRSADDVVEHRGEFALRGGIVDLFPATRRRPIRAEFFGDEIESLREFTPATQLSTGRVEGVLVHPCRELLVTDDVRRRAEVALPRFQ